MMSITDTIDYFDKGYFHIQHPYADFTFKTFKPTVCGGTLCITVWDLKGKISFDGNVWYSVEDLNPKDGQFVEYYYDSMFNNYGWLSQDIYVTIEEIIKNSIFKKFKLISLSNTPLPVEYEFNCRELSLMDRKLLLKLDTVKTELSKDFTVKQVSLSEEQIIVIEIIDENLPTVNPLVETLTPEVEKIIFDLEEKMNYILKRIGITRFSIGRIHKHN